MVKFHASDLASWVRFPLPAPLKAYFSTVHGFNVSLNVPKNELFLFTEGYINFESDKVLATFLSTVKKIIRVGSHFVAKNNKK